MTIIVIKITLSVILGDLGTRQAMLSFYFQAVQQVVSNLLIGHIELRSEESIDIQGFTHERKIEKMVVPFEGQILEVKNQFKAVRIYESVRNCK